MRELLEALQGLSDVAVVSALGLFAIRALRDVQRRKRPSVPPPTPDEITGRFAQMQDMHELRDGVREIRDGLGVRGGTSNVETLLKEILAEARKQSATLDRIDKSQSDETRLLCKIADGQMAVAAHLGYPAE